MRNRLPGIILFCDGYSWSMVYKKYIICGSALQLLRAQSTFLWIWDCEPSKTAVRMSETPGRPMKFPYTLSAKIAQFPMKYYVQNQWIWRYWMLGIALSLPVFYKIHKLANSPENVSKWAEIRRKEAAGHH